MSQPININGSNIYFKPPKTEYLFILNLTTNDMNVKEFVKISSKKYVNLIDFKDEINVNDIKKFKIKIQNISNMVSYEYESDFLCEFEEKYKTFKNTNIYVEFTKNTKLFISCKCYLNANDIDRIFVTPPNY